MSRPYDFRSIIPFYYNDPMNVIWHNDKCIHMGAMKMYWYFLPHLLNHLPHRIQCHLPMNYLTEKTSSPLRDNGDEICTILGITVPLQTQ